MIDYPHELAAISQERDQAVARAEKLEQDFAAMFDERNHWRREASHWSAAAGNKIWHGCDEEPQGAGVGERIVVLAVPGGQYAVDVWTWTRRHGWLSSTQGNGLSVCDCLRWAHERDVIEHVFGGVR